MRIGRLQLLALVLGGVLVGGMVSVSAQEEPTEETRPEEGLRRHHRGPGPLKHAMRGEFVLPPNDDGEVRTIRTDRGVLASVDGSTLVIEEADATTVEVPVNDDTTIRRDGEEASLDDLEAGDHVHAFRERIDDGDFTTRGLRAISAERFTEMQERREACRENPDECRHPRRERFGPRGPAGFEPPIEGAEAA